MDSLHSAIAKAKLEASWTTTIAAVGAIVFVSRVVKLVNGLKAVGSLPGLRIPAQPLALLGVVLPETWWNPGLLFTWTWRKNKNIYRYYGSDTVSIVPFIDGVPALYTQSMEVARQVVSAGHRSGAFGKTDSMGRAFLFWGPSIVAVESEQWRKHRRIAGPAFNNEIYTLVWEASRRLYAEMISAEGWASKDVIETPSIQSLTFKFTLIIFASVGFGLPFTWTDPPAHNNEMTVQECIGIISRTNIFAIAAPGWAWKLPFEWVRRTRRAYDTMRAFMQSQVSTRREAIRSEADDGPKKSAKDVFSLLVRASENEGGKMGLDDNELIGNVFALMFAGHETTAHTLAATLGFLALDADLQDEIVAQVQDVTRGREDGEVLLEDYSKLDKVLAAFYEGVRLFPSGVFLIREAKQDTVLNISDSEEARMLPVKKGTHIVVDMIGVQYNPRYFAEPEEFKPSRWYKKSQEDADKKEDLSESEEYTAFSVGPRSCLGRKFATTEAVCLLALMLRDWRVEPLLMAKSDGKVETRQEWRERVMQATMNLTMGIKDVPLRFSRRT
ncbi:hypothetical protein HYDPIDRAFT_149950 [Hydnomerulius pinastri MD-312]|nr:hypothetical protein HYDPIDRAFT_149950 [Hydnomerulius pinastri MD-312]